MIVRTAQCPKCHDEIYSRAQHDFRECSCSKTGKEGISVDGGRDYFRFGHSADVDFKKVIFRNRRLKVTTQQLYKDWNENINKLGIINKKGKHGRKSSG